MVRYVLQLATLLERVIRFSRLDRGVAIPKLKAHYSHERLRTWLSIMTRCGIGRQRLLALTSSGDCLARLICLASLVFGLGDHCSKFVRWLRGKTLGKPEGQY